MSKEVTFHSEEIKFLLKQKNRHRSWLAKLTKKEGYRIDELNYIFCSDTYLHEVNVGYLNHDDYTDIITFDNSDKPKLKIIEGDIFISIDRVKENAIKYSTTFEKELTRVMAHGLLHLMGYRDKSAKDKTIMRKKEEESMVLFLRTK